MANKKNCPIGKKTRPTCEWYKDGKPQYYCLGYIDLMNDLPLEECENCKKFVSHAQENLDEWNRRNMA